MRYRKLSATGDYTFGNGLKNFYVDVPAAVGQAVGTRLKLWLGEWSFDTETGTPYLTGIIGKHGLAEADQTIQGEVGGTTGLTGISAYDSNYNTVARSLSVRMTVETIYGPTVVTLQNYRNF